MKKIFLGLVILCFSFQFAFASEGENNKSKENRIKIEKLKQKEKIVKQKITYKLEKKLSIYDDLSDEDKKLIYSKLISTINTILDEKWVSKTEKALYTLLKRIVQERKDKLNK